MTQLVEQVAKAQQSYMRDNGCDCLFLEDINYMRGIARAAIKAMREPTAAMKQEGFQYTGDPCWPEDVGNTWRAMIDEALK